MIGIGHGLNSFTLATGLGLNPYFTEVPEPPVGGPVVSFRLTGRSALIVRLPGAQGLDAQLMGRTLLYRRLRGADVLSVRLTGSLKT